VRPLLVRAPFFNEFVVKAPCRRAGVGHDRRARRARAGLPDRPVAAEYAEGLLVCVTEVASDAAIDRLVEVVAGTTGRVRASGGR
jgi:glycine cleavage system pyridoxal-binding protein P